MYYPLFFFIGVGCTVNKKRIFIIVFYSFTVSCLMGCMNGYTPEFYSINLNNEKHVSRTSKHTVKVAILDTGVDSKYSVLSSRIIQGYNFVDYNDVYDDYNGHYTNTS
jgi:hypothetical protein